MGIRYDAERDSFVEGKRYVPPATVAERLEQAEAKAAMFRGELASVTAQHDELHDLWLDAEQGKTEAEAEVERLREESTRLRCCANCGQPHSLSLGECYSESYGADAPGATERGWPAIEPDWRCQFYPSHWTARGGEGARDE
jgi:hypothetical protein